MFFNITKNQNIIDFLKVNNINSFIDVLNYVPYRYEKFFSTKETNILDKEKIVFHGRLLTIPKVNSFNNKIIRFIFITNNNNKFIVDAYNKIYLLKILTLKKKYIISGVFDKSKNLIKLNKIIVIDKIKRMIEPIYSLPKKISQHIYRKFIDKVFSKIDKIDNTIPDFCREKYKLLDELSAFKAIHQPKKSIEIKNAFRTLKYKECLTFFLKMFLIKKKIKIIKKNKKTISFAEIKKIIDKFDFKLTNSQICVIKEILLDMNKNKLMYRLLQGDVGSGKTVIAILALYANYLRGDQGVLMVPTDALARQHFFNISNFFKDFSQIKIVLLVGKMNQKQKKDIEKNIFQKKVDIVIGTHSLFSQSVNYHSLGLIIIDEQHYFGIDQRLKLINKSKNSDVLLMSATPIPRTFALTFYGDLDVSILEDIPFPKKIKTLIVKEDDKIIYSLIDSLIKDKKQVYIVTSNINSNNNSVEKIFHKYNLKYPNKVLLLHGKLDINQKIDVLEKFKKNQFSIIVSTSIIEVGLDIKNANLMIIYDPINFGLASLHQLRGRIGRDGTKSFCLLVYNGVNLKEKQKLEILVNSNDGFYIANKDLEMRGPGEINGLKQSGLQDFNFVDFVKDFKIFECAKKDAQLILKNRN